MRVLRRPMFRGGDTGGGITTGLGTPKRGLVDGPGGYSGDLQRVQSQLALIDQLAPQQGSNLNNFLILDVNSCVCEIVLIFLENINSKFC